MIVGHGHTSVHTKNAHICYYGNGNCYDCKFMKSVWGTVFTPL